MNAGIDVFLSEPAIMDVCKSADTVVVQTPAAHNMSNRFYSVHQRRNDRFLKASVLLETIFREIDFTEFSFTRHMLTALKTASPDRFETVVDELRTAWVARMELLLSKIECRKILVHVTSEADETDPGVFGVDPLFVDPSMVQKLEDCADEIVVVSAPAKMASSTEGMLFPEFEELAARQIIGPEVHEMVAERLTQVLNRKKPTG